MVVGSESKNTCMYFLQNLLDSFACDINLLAFISDMKKGLGEAITNVFPTS